MCSAGAGTAVNSKKHHTDGQDISLMCRLCDESSEMVMHLSIGCTVLVKSKYRIPDDIVAKHIHGLLLKEMSGAVTYPML